MSVASSTGRLPVEVVIPAGAAERGGRVGEVAAQSARVFIIVVTFNRKPHAVNVIGAIAGQDYPRELMDVVIVDNAGTDGTLEAIVERWKPERVIRNETPRASEPNFQKADVTMGSACNAAGFRSLTVVRNQANLGGCGGFNTGFAFIDAVSRGEIELAGADGTSPFGAGGGAGASGGSGGGPDRLWLVDDDIDLPTDALPQLLKAMASDERIGIVGSRMVNLNDREHTYETTIYLDHLSGQLSPQPIRGHRCFDSHFAWEKMVGGVHGRFTYTGTREVDIVAACSLLARWEAVKKVGFWDDRFFIYCDDADWCLRMAQAGYRVMLNLDAVVYHIPWLLKSTPERSYYAQRNAAWMTQKNFHGWRLKRVMARKMWGILKDSLRAMVMRREFHAEILRRTAHDAITGRGGKLDIGNGPKPVPLKEGFAQVGALRAGAEVVFLCNQPDSLKWARQVRDNLRAQLAASSTQEPRWTIVVRNTVPGYETAGDEDGGWARRMVYGGRLPSRLKKQFAFARLRPAACIVFENTNDMPVLLGGRGGNIHIDLKDATVCQPEHDGWGVRGRFAARWFGTALRAAWFVLTCRSHVMKGKFA
ncbi:MAG: glycosyltransferase family 2 protein [Phycisphaeraceae bacterium]|nr:glycosyltransferase family 2 protein [Phycisphaeraceae bacterium]